MQFIIKFFPEITIKSPPVRKRFIKQLRGNLKVRLKVVDERVEVVRDWDKLTVAMPSDISEQQVEETIEILSNTPGIANFLEVVEYPYIDFDDTYQKVAALYADKIVGKTFAVRCKRAGKHDFNSNDIERYVGGGLYQNFDNGGVKLKHPDVTVAFELRDQQLFVIKQQYKGLGGFPMGSIDSVLSLVSGGFDSTAASYMTMKRGIHTHFCFFRLGGRAHEIGVKEISYYLWHKYSYGCRVKFVTVPFEEVVAEILKNVDDSQMGVILKRMMLRSANKVAAELEVDALVTGEAVAQVSSQTLINLNMIDQVSERVVLRPLITTDKTDIIDMVRMLGLEKQVASIPEYCGVISVKPTTKAKQWRLEKEEEAFNFDVLEQAIAKAEYVNIDQIAEQQLEVAEVEIFAAPVQGSIILDVRHPTEQERKPLVVAGQEVVELPFYELHSKFEQLDQNKHYLLYCDKGVMSRLHASHLAEQGAGNVAVYRPA